MDFKKLINWLGQVSEPDEHYGMRETSGVKLNTLKAALVLKHVEDQSLFDPRINPGAAYANLVDAAQSLWDNLELSLQMLENDFAFNVPSEKNELRVTLRSLRLALATHLRLDAFDKPKRVQAFIGKIDGIVGKVGNTESVIATSLGDSANLCLEPIRQAVRQWHEAKTDMGHWLRLDSSRNSRRPDDGLAL